MIGLLVLSVFLWFEIRRYRFYDVWRSRVRLVQEQVFAEVFDPTTDDPPSWREQFGEDLRAPTFKVSAFEAASRRIRRVYGPLSRSWASPGWRR